MQFPMPRKFQSLEHRVSEPETPSFKAWNTEFQSLEHPRFVSVDAYVGGRPPPPLWGSSPFQAGQFQHCFCKAGQFQYCSGKAEEFNLSLFLFPMFMVPVPIAVVAVSVSIAVPITISPAVRVHAIKQEGHVVQRLALVEGFDVWQLPAVEPSGTHHEHGEVGNAVGNAGIGDDAHRHVVGNDDVVAGAQLVEQFIQAAVHQQLGRVGRHGACRDYVKVTVGVDDFVHGERSVGQEVGHAVVVFQDKSDYLAQSAILHTSVVM